MNFLFRPVSITSLVFFRIMFGILAIADVLGTFIYKHLYLNAFDPLEFHFTYYGFEWVRPFAEPWMSLFFLSALLAALAVLLGKWYRVCAAYFALCFVYMFLMEKSFYLNHGYLFSVLSFLMVLLPANRAFSMDVLKRPAMRLNTIPYWPLFLLQFSMAVVYFFGGIAKINPDWLQAQPLKIWLGNKADMPLLGWLWAKETTAWVLSYGGLLLDLFIVLFLVIRRTRIWAFAFILFFHTTNLILFKIGIFPFLSVSLSLLFFPSDFPLKVFQWLTERWPKLDRLQQWWDRKLNNSQAAPQPPVGKWQYRPNQQRVISLLVVLYILIHLLVPLRHHYFKGDVAWTEEGHRYAWRMMLRSKRAYGHFKVVNLETQENVKVSPDDYMTKRQRRKMLSHPDMILQFAHFLETEYRKQGWMDIAVFANISARLNQHPYQAYIDSKVDLTKEHWSFLKESDWIIPFRKPDK